MENALSDSAVYFLKEDARDPDNLLRVRLRLEPPVKSQISVIVIIYRFSHVTLYNRDIQYFPGNKKAAINAA